MILEKFGIDVSSVPLNDYRKKSFYFMKTDALDRFGTRLEKRFSKLLLPFIRLITKSSFKVLDIFHLGLLIHIYARKIK